MSIVTGDTYSDRAHDGTLTGRFDTTPLWDSHHNFTGRQGDVAPSSSTYTKTGAGVSARAASGVKARTRQKTGKGKMGL